MNFSSDHYCHYHDKHSIANIVTYHIIMVVELTVDALVVIKSSDCKEGLLSFIYMTIV